MTWLAENTLTICMIGAVALACGPNRFGQAIGVKQESIALAEFDVS